MKHLLDLSAPPSDRFGFYQVGDKKFYHKLHAIQEMARSGIHLEWKFHDEVFSCYDWSQEPTQTLSELYRRRAEQIREKYDYIVIMYSGGADSHNMLDAFVNNNIPFEEILTMHNVGAPAAGIDMRGHGNNPEILRVSIPYAQKIVERLPHVKLRIVDQTPFVRESLQHSELLEIFYANVAANANSSGLNLQFKLSWDPELIKLRASGKRVCFLVGTDKPRVWEINGRWCFRFLDIFDCYANPAWDDGTEFFYWSPDLPQLLIKQSHIIKRYMQQITPQSPFVTTKTTSLACRSIDNKTFWLEDHGVHKLLYPTWNTNTFTMGKDPDRVFGWRDIWIRQMNPETEVIAKNYREHFSTWAQSLPDYWKNDPTDISKGMKGCWSNPYYLD